MENIRIVEYEHKYAKAVADMWNKSTSGWGGGNGETTEESVIRAHENMVNINNFLAMEGDAVLGYCSFSEYREDEGALYIPVLNVRPDCHGKGIGKKLVLTAVRRCVELDWPRLDLYTWPGNTKAVPLYKKCGFFWERRDDITHLMNFIPTVLKTGAVSDYFKRADWYLDSKRMIEIKPDGDTENGFDYFRYDWEKDGSKLGMEFERRGRGLRLIETDDYLLQLSLETGSPVFGRRYKATYRVTNKSGKPLSISIKGKDDKNIKYGFQTQLSVRESEVIESEFLVDIFEEEPSEWCTHPSVTAEVLINGKKAGFKVGVIPKLPVKLGIAIPGKVSFLNMKSTVYIEAENNFNSPVTVRFRLESSEKVEFQPQDIVLQLNANERVSVPVEYILKEHCLYSIEHKISCSMEDGIELNFKHMLEAMFAGYTGRFWGENKDFWFVVNGRNTIKFSKLDNELVIGSTIKEYFETFFFYPRMGKPYSGEFSKKRPSKVEFEPENDAVVMKATYDSEDFCGLKLVSVSKLGGNGILERYYEVINTLDTELGSDAWVSENVFYNIYGSIIPYEGKYIESKEFEDGDMDLWDCSKISENWIFSRNDRVTRGIAWSKNYRINMDGYYMFFESCLGKLGPGETAGTNPVFIAYDTFANWKDFRAFSTGSLRTDKVQLTDSVDVIINNGNPFVSDSLNVKVKDYKQTYLNDTIGISSANNCFEPMEIVLDEATRKREVDFDISLKTAKQIDILNTNISTDTMELEQRKAVFRTAPGEIKQEIMTLEGFETYVADNGCIKIKAAPGYAHSLFSMTYNGNEWLDNNFPVIGPRSWFNPWVGGIEMRPEKFLPASAAKEPREVSFAKLKDNFGNSWQGLKVSYNIVNNPAYKGLSVNQYFLLLPGCPVMCNTVEFVQNTGKLLNDIWTINLSFIAADKELSKRWFMLKDKTGKAIKYKCGKVGQEIQTAAPIMHGSDSRNEKLLVITDSDDMHTVLLANNMIVSNKLLGRLIAKDGSRTFTQPVFYVFSESYIDNEEINDLKSIKFI